MKLHLHQVGPASGRPLLLLNPFPLHRGVWADNVPAWVGKGCRVLTLDYPGLEPSPSPSGHPPQPDSDGRASTASIDAIADAVLAELDADAIAKVVVLGVSMGGYVALSLATRFATRLAGLVLVDTRAAADSPAARAGRATALATLQLPGVGNPEAGVDAYLAASLPKLLAPGAPPSLHERVRQLAVRRREGLVAGIIALRDRPDRTSALPALRMPALVLCGTEDQIVPPAEMQELSRAIPGARFEAIPGAGHLPNLEQPARFEQAVSAFLAELFGAAR